MTNSRPSSNALLPIPCDTERFRYAAYDFLLLIERMLKIEMSTVICSVRLQGIQFLLKSGFEKCKLVEMKKQEQNLALSAQKTQWFLVVNARVLKLVDTLISLTFRKFSAALRHARDIVGDA